MLTVKILDSVIQKQGKLVFLFQPVISLANLKLQTLSYSDLVQLLSVFPVHDLLNEKLGASGTAGSRC